MERLDNIIIISLILIMSILLLVLVSLTPVQDDDCLQEQGKLIYSYYNVSTGEVTRVASNHIVYIDICKEVYYGI